jgi:Protein of unknown function (DUF3667)
LQTSPSDPLAAHSSSVCGPPQGIEGGAYCANCGTALGGQFCGSCGQRAEAHSHSFWSFVAEAAEALTHADSRLWSTLALLLGRPGFLTKQFLDGRRARYLPPLRLYLALSFLFFLIISFTSSMTSRTVDMPDVVDPTALDTKSLQQNESDKYVAGKRERILNLCNVSVGQMPGPDWLRRPFLSACVRTAADRSRELGRAFVHNLGRALFLLLPLLAAIMVLLYRRPKRYYVDHLLLLVHNHACVFLVLSGFVVGARWIHAGTLARCLTLALVTYLLIYFYASMRRVYGDSRVRTLIKFLALSLGYLVCGACAVLLTGLYSATTL